MHMHWVKKLCIQLFLLSEMTFFGYWYVYGVNGMVELQEQKKVVVDLDKDITLLSDEVLRLEKEIYAWQTDDFFKEKVAREQLQMARKGDELFYIG
jgi:cell division protein FtsB